MDQFSCKNRFWSGGAISLKLDMYLFICKYLMQLRLHKNNKMAGSKMALIAFYALQLSFYALASI